MTDLATIKGLSATGRHKDCLDACQIALRITPEEGYAYKYAGKSLIALGQYEKAEQFLQRALQLDSNDPEILKDIGNIFNAFKNDKEAIKYYNLSLICDPNYAPAANNLGLMAKKHGNLMLAKQLVERARSLDPLCVPFHLNLSSIYKDLRQLDEALAITLKTVELEPHNTNTHLSLGEIYKDLGRLDLALAATLKALELKPDNPDTYMNLGGIYKELGQPDNALKVTLKSLEIRPDNSEANMNLGSIYKELGQLDNALKATMQSLCLKPDNAGANMNLGSIYKELGQLDNALKATLKSHSLEPDNPTVNMNLGGIYKDLGQLDNALKATLKSVELQPDHPEANMNLGGIYRDLGKTNQALAATLRSIELEPDNPTAHMNLGGVYQELGKLDKALVATHKSLELKPDNPDAHMNLGGIYHDLGQLNQALAATIRSIELKPHSPTTHLNLGKIYSDLGNIKKTRESFIQAAELEKNSLERHIQTMAIIDKIYDSNSHIDRCRDEFERGLKRINEEKCLKYNNQEVSFGIFWLAYHNRDDDKRILEMAANTLIQNKSFNPNSVEESLQKKKFAYKEKIRVGIVSDFMGDHVVGWHFRALVDYLVNSGIEVIIFNGPNTKKEDSHSNSNQGIKLHKMSSSIDSSCKLIKEEVLDVLLFTEIGMSAHTYTIALSRLAPVQAVLPGHPNTTGIPTIDYFISSKLLEDEDSDKYYTERLIRLNRLCSTMEIPQAPHSKANRSKYGFSTKTTIVGFPHSLFKLHPDFDEILSRLEKEIPNTTFVYFKSPNNVLAEKIKDRWKKQNPNLIVKSVFLEKVPHLEFVQLIELMDFILDPLYFGAGTVFCDAMAVGTPIVTMPQKQMRSRVVSASYKHIGVQKPPIATNIDEYINICKELAFNKTLRISLKEELKLLATSKLYDYNKVLEEYLSFITAAVQSSRDGKLLPNNWNSNIH